MGFITVFLLILIHGNLIYSKSIVLNRRHINPTLINYEENYVRTKINPSAQTNNEADNPETQISLSQKTSVTQMKFNLFDYPHPIESARRLNPSDQLYTKLIPRSDITEKQATRQQYIAADVYATSPRTTSEDTLQMLLKKQLPFFDPAPHRIGQQDIGIMLPVTEALWIFEDYDDMTAYSDRVRDSYQSCEGQKVRCIGDTEYSQPVCVTDLTIPTSVPQLGRLKGFSSNCEVEYRNCIKRFERTGKYYAASYNEDYLEFFHYGWCEFCHVVVYCTG